MKKMVMNNNDDVDFLEISLNLMAARRDFYSFMLIRLSSYDSSSSES